MAKEVGFNSDKAAETINAMHKKFAESFMTGLQCAVEAGSMLTNVKRTLKHGDFVPWCKVNLAFKQRTAQNYMKLFDHKDQVLLANATSISEALSLIRGPDDEDDEYKREEKAPKDVTPVENLDPAFWYWKPLKILVADMYKAYSSLARKRNSTTPSTLGWAIGNVKDMASVLETWNPEGLIDCTKCKGTGVRKVKDKEVVCGNSINGKLGHAKKSEF